MLALRMLCDRPVPVLLAVPARPENPCELSPCGSNAVCIERNGHASCSCKPGFLGAPPNCRHECVLSSDCAPRLACVENKCRNPCENRCGTGALCTVRNHQPLCRCPPGYTGDASRQCRPVPRAPSKYMMHYRLPQTRVTFLMYPRMYSCIYLRTDGCVSS